MSGDPRNSFEALYRTSYQQVYRRIFALVGNSEQAQDLAQEVFLKAWRAWPPTSRSEEPEPEQFSALLMTIARRTAIDALRANACRPTCQSLEALGGRRAEVLFASPIDEEETSLSRLTFLAAWERLPVRERRLLWRRASGARLKQLAEEEGCHKSNIARRLVQARIALRRYYRKEHIA